MIRDAPTSSDPARKLTFCSDNPFLDISGLNLLAKTFKKSNVDYCSFLIDNKLPSIKSHLGLWTEAVKLSALQKIRNSTNSPIYLEHVTNYIYENKNNFKIKYINVPSELVSDSVRLTVDTENDFNIIKIILEKINSNDLLNNKNVIKFVQDNNYILELMRTEINRNEK